MFPDRDDDHLWSSLDPYELRWQERQPFLQSKGYALRPRYRPGWVPSWRGTGKYPSFCEDGILLPGLRHLIDATRISDGELVYIKRVGTGDNESKIAAMLSTETLRRDPRNHSVPILDIFQDSDDQAISYMVMPFLRLTDRPEFEIVEDVVNFVDQMLEGLIFMHEQGVAHRDCSERNVMMDANQMFPQGFHPIKTGFLPDAKTPARPLARSQVSVKYYYVDYGISIYIPPDVHPKLALGEDGRDRDVPELSIFVPYDPFKVDIFIIGNMLKRIFLDKYTNVGFLLRLHESMTQRDPARRPDSQGALREWQAIRSSLWRVHRKWRLRSRRYWLDNPYYDVVSIYNISTSLTTELVGWGTELQG
ncbi:hypothetical protein IEO21_02572 [Rhodonia placenta]|uniref:Protein kinase domain-containing protein n=1 Tax=Rhodonia placenta TaxID=104341 RepID=A0A8H7P7D7_9APHY|nr:hypothetical protein IEO21_02572 [Postia placenta]